LLSRTTAILATIFMALALALALLNRGTAGVGGSLLNGPPPVINPAGPAGMAVPHPPAAKALNPTPSPAPSPGTPQPPAPTVPTR
jgi:preprotein translocase subunit SecG